MKVFDKWSVEDVVVKDLGLARYICLDKRLVMHTFGNFANKRFGSKDQNIVERLINKMMRSGQGKRKLGGHVIRGRKATGKKLQAMKATMEAFDIIHSRTNGNPIQYLVDAISKAAPNEDVTRLKKGGVAYTESVDVSPYAKLNESLKNLSLAVFGATFNKKIKFSEALAEEILLAASGDNKSYAVKRKDEIERIAKASR